MSAGLGALIAGVGSYVTVALLSPFDVTTAQYLTLDAKGELELEGISILIALMFSGAVALVGSWMALWLFNYRFGSVTALVLAPILYFGAVPIEELHRESVFFTTWGAYGFALLLSVWPFFAAIIARGVIVVLARERAERPAETGWRFSDRRPQ